MGLTQISRPVGNKKFADNLLTFMASLLQVRPLQPVVPGTVLRLCRECHAWPCVMEISQPRQPCWKLSRRWGLPNLAVLVQQNGRTGWYLRVIKAGQIEAGMTLELIARPFPEFSVQRANTVMYAKPRRPVDDQWLSQCPALSEAWRTDLEKRLRSATPGREENQMGNNHVE